MQGLLLRALDARALVGTCVEALELRSFRDAYKGTFSLVPCITQVQKEEILRLRHDIFCREYGYEPESYAGSGREHDHYDERAVHYALLHKASNSFAGALRLILPDDERPGESFPIQKHCDHPLLASDSRVLTLCEISRFCMAPQFRKRTEDGRLLSAYHGQDMIQVDVDGEIREIRRKIPYPQAALLAGAFETALEARIMDCVWMAPPEHLESLAKIGFLYRTLGPRVAYHGGTQPIIFNIKHVLDNMRRNVPSCWEIVSDGGRLHEMADRLDQNDWTDRLLDDACIDRIFEKLD